MSLSSPEERLMLLSAGTAARREDAGASIQGLLGEVDWESLTGILRTRRLLAMLGPRIVELGGERVPAPFSAAVDRGLADGRRLGTVLALITGRVRDALSDAQIRSSALKGPLLSEALYGDPGRRPSGDIDLLVAAEQLADAVTVVRGLGYSAPTDQVSANGLPLVHFALFHERQDSPPVELHWRVHWYEERYARERLLAPESLGPGDWHPEPIDELAALLLFYARDGFVNLRHATDVGAWWDIHGAELEPGALQRLASEYPALQRVLTVAASVAGRTVGLPAERLIPAAGRLVGRGRVAARLAEPYRGSSEAQVYADIGLIDGLLAPPGGFGEFLTRQVLPSRDGLLQHAGPEESGRRLPLGHGARVLSRYALALSRLLRLPKALSSR